MNLQDWHDLFQLPWPEFWPLLQEASRRRAARFGPRVSLCVIINAKSGGCGEDCAFCSQAKAAQTEISRYPLLPQEELVQAAKAAASQGAARFSLVTAGRGIEAAPQQTALVDAVAAIAAAARVKACASLGIVERPFLADLKAAGLYRFHHNLETSESFFPQICSTHAYRDRVATIEAAKAAGLSVCAGGIFGLGESVAQRFEMAQALRDLDVDAIPLNFLHPLPGTRLAGRPLLPPLEALKIIVAFRLMFPDKTIIICGGRTPTLRSLAPLIFAAGANALMTGDYLTTKGRLPDEDREMLRDLDLELSLDG